MAEKIVTKIVGSLGALVSIPFMKEIIIFIFSAGPILEIRGGLIAASLMHMDPLESYIICFLGNVLPIPFILWLVTKMLTYMRASKVKFFNKIAAWLDKKVEKNKSKIEKYGYVGLVLLVAIPLPGTGVWTASLVASVLEMDKKKAFIATVIGLVIVSLIMMGISFGIISKII